MGIQITGLSEWFSRRGNAWRRDNVVASVIGVDPSYQRGYSIKWAEEIASNFDTYLAAGIKVSRRADGSLWVIDGQHRIRAWQMVKGEHTVIPVEVIEGLTVQQEADMFSQQNNRRNINPIQTHRALVTAGNPVDLEIERILAKHGLIMADQVGAKNQPEKQFAAIRALRVVVERRGSTHADEVLSLVIEGLGRPGKRVTANHISGMDAFLARFGERVNRERLLRVLKDSDPTDINQQAAALRRVMGKNHEGAWGMVFHSIYNRKLSSGRLPEWDSFNVGEMRRRNASLRDGEI